MACTGERQAHSGIPEGLGNRLKHGHGASFALDDRERQCKWPPIVRDDGDTDSDRQTPHTRTGQDGTERRKRER